MRQDGEKDEVRSDHKHRSDGGKSPDRAPDAHDLPIDTEVKPERSDQEGEVAKGVPLRSPQTDHRRPSS